MRARIDDTNTACRFFFLSFFLLLYSEHLIQMTRPTNRLLSVAVLFPLL